MTPFETFLESLSRREPPADLDAALQALWWAQKGEWDKAHEYVQAHEGEPRCDLVHAYLHRQEGDTANARYWYRNAGRTLPTVSLADEWRDIAAELLSPN
jgi:hypothetical protein